MLRLSIVLSALLVALSAAAQVVSPIEQSYGPYQRPGSGYEPALMVSEHGILLAWSEIVPPLRLAQIHIGLLDFHGRLISPIAVVPAASETSTAPVIVRDGDAYRVEYLVFNDPYAVDIDARGAILGAPRRSGRPAPAFTSKWEIGPALWCTWGCLSVERYLALTWSYLSMTGSHRNERIETVTPAAAGGTREHFLIAWGTLRGISYVEYVNGAKTTATPLIPASLLAWQTPAIACDATHCLIAFTTNAQQIYGALIDSANPSNAVPVAIETASRSQQPQVLLLEPGRFLVTYVSVHEDTQPRFAGRIVTTAPLPRRRAVH